MEEIGINDTVVVTLTDYGKEVVRRHWKQQDYRTPPPTDQMKGQLWHIMEIFGGSNIGLGYSVPFQSIKKYVPPDIPKEYLKENGYESLEDWINKNRYQKEED